MSSSATGIRPLGTNPRSRIIVPLVASVDAFGERRFDFVPTSLVVEGSANHLRDERAALPCSKPRIQLGDQLISELNV